MTEHEELLKLRALVEKQAAELAAKNQIIEAQNSQIEKQNDKIEKHILGMIAVILSSDFEIIDPEDLELDGQAITVIPELICEEILMYISLI